MDPRAALIQRSPAWFAARVDRLTASRAPAACGISPYASADALMREMLAEHYGESARPDSEALRYGREHEPVAIAAYSHVTGNRVTSAGLFVAGDYLGASPDGLVESDAAGPGLLEVKCPAGRRLTTLSQREDYWLQCQLQCLCTGRLWCDFFVWTPRRTHLERLRFDRLRLAPYLRKLETFYRRYQAVLRDPVAQQQYRRA